VFALFALGTRVQFVMEEQISFQAHGLQPIICSSAIL
jgi:hypothetical protein